MKPTQGTDPHTCKAVPGERNTARRHTNPQGEQHQRHGNLAQQVNRGGQPDGYMDLKQAQHKACQRCQTMGIRTMLLAVGPVQHQNAHGDV